MTAKDTLLLTKFPVVVTSDCRNIHRVYPLKQKEVAAIYDAVKDCKEVRKVIIFGSAVTGYCHVGSDLDICIDADASDGMKIYELQKIIGTICDWNCDIIMYSNMGNRLKETVGKEGVVIYE